MFQLVVVHCPSTRDPKNVCTLLQLSTDCRKTLQQTRGQCRVQLEAVHVRRCAKFLTWLKSHSGLVKELVLLQHNPPDEDDSYGYGSYDRSRVPCLPDVMSFMLATGFSACSTPWQAAQQVPGAAVAGAGPAAGPLPLRLQRVTIRNPERFPDCNDSFVTVPLLAALGAAGVQRLEVDVTLSKAEKAIAASISTVTTLQDLVLTLTPASSKYEARPSTGRLCTALHPLSKLTRLEALVNPGAAHHLPPSLRELELLARPPVWDEHLAYPQMQQPDLQPDQIGVADLCHLTALTRLALRNAGPCTDSVPATTALEVCLPADLPQLRVFGYASISGFGRLGRAEVNAYAPCDVDILHQLAPCKACSTLGRWSLVSSSAVRPVALTPTTAACLICLVGLMKMIMQITRLVLKQYKLRMLWLHQHWGLATTSAASRLGTVLNPMGRLRGARSLGLRRWQACSTCRMSGSLEPSQSPRPSGT